ncbi:hypothetical protein SteCoe_5767 [Stentor coeruleus]|uniref:Uncharacterized protein n=1 Tax=Stentor coeruleus TaxID=5963 RepID=A0A1R2CRK0_9CILI|nr:hypothetical protein SteCoe_5767 [Stentor coeruleus]
MDKEDFTTDRVRLDNNDESTSFLYKSELPNDIDKVNDFKKALEAFALDDDSDLIGDLSQIVPDSRPYNIDKYDSVLLNARSSRALCLKFDSEPCGLIKSDAKNQDFSLLSILNRMKTGHKVYKYNYNTPSRKIVTVKINQGIIEIYTSETRKKRLGFSDIYGVILGSVSSTFKMNKSQIEFKYGKLHTQEDCFSVITDLRSYDFGTISYLAMYDICLSLSWLCCLNNCMQSSIPFTKCDVYVDFLSYRNVFEKLKREASIRFMSIHELFLVKITQLAIYKTLKQMENTTVINKIVTILNKRFSFSGKLYRFIRFIIMPLICGDSYTKKELKDRIRINLLIGNKLKALNAVINQIEDEDNKFKANTKKTVLESMIVPSCRSIFRKPKASDNFLAALRKKAVVSKKK